MAILDSNEDGANLLRSSSSSRDNLGVIEMQKIPRRSRQGKTWLNRSSFLWLKRKHYLTALGVVFVLSLLLLVRQHQEELAVKLKTIPLVHFTSTPHTSQSPQEAQKLQVAHAAQATQAIQAIETEQLAAVPGASNLSQPTIEKDSKAQLWVKPTGIKIIALVFYGRPETVSILDCYLKQNLASNGGFLDEVHWAVNTDHKDALEYLDKLVKTSDGYKKTVLPGLGFDSVWKHGVKKGNIYIKIDDDIVFIHENAIPNLIYTKINHPDAFAVSANIINSPSLSWLHYHMGAIHAYLPETKAPDEKAEQSSSISKAWRASSLPQWKGDNITFPLGRGTNNDGVVEPDDPGAPPFSGHRWLPLRDNNNSLMRTPISETEFDAYGNGWKSWAIAAQQHYSLLQNIEAGEMDRYHFGRKTNERESIYTMGDSRMNINFLCILGDDVVANFPFPDVDEPALSWKLPQKLQRPLLINTHASVAHFTFMTQHDCYTTDLLSRYRAYANEMVCLPDNQITPV